MGNRGSKQKMKLLAGKHIVKTADGWDSNCLEKLTTKGKGGVESVECPYITSTKVFFGEFHLKMTHFEFIFSHLTIFHFRLRLQTLKTALIVARQLWVMA